jgi:hypothetical protein
LHHPSNSCYPKVINVPQSDSFLTDCLTTPYKKKKRRRRIKGIETYNKTDYENQPVQLKLKNSWESQLQETMQRTESRLK